MPDEEVLDPPKKKIKFDKDGLPIPQNIRQSVQLDEEGLPIPLQKKNGISNGLTNGEDVATTSVPSTSPLPSGLIKEGNIDLRLQPKVRNKEKGGESTVWSMSIGTDEGEVLLTRVTPEGKILSEKEAEDYYRKTGKHLGIFKTPDEATAYSRELHDRYAAGEFDKPKSTSPLPVNDPFSFDRFIPKKLDNAQVPQPLPKKLPLDIIKDDYLANKEELDKTLTSEIGDDPTFGKPVSGDSLFNAMADPNVADNRLLEKYSKKRIRDFNNEFELRKQALNQKYPDEDFNVGTEIGVGGTTSLKPKEYYTEVDNLNKEIEDKRASLLDAVRTVAQVKSVNKRLKNNEKFDKKEIGREVRKAIGDPTVAREERLEMKGIPLSPADKYYNDKVGYIAMATALKEMDDAGVDIQNDVQAKALFDNVKEGKAKLLSENKDFTRQQAGKLISNAIAKDKNWFQVMTGAYTINNDDIKKYAKELNIPDEIANQVTESDIQTANVFGTFANELAVRPGANIGSFIGRSFRREVLGQDPDAIDYHYEQLNKKFTTALADTPDEQALFATPTEIQGDVTQENFLEDVRKFEQGKFNWSASAIATTIANGAGQMIQYGLGGTAVAGGLTGINRVLGASSNIDRAKKVGLVTYGFLNAYEPSYQQAREVVGDDPDKEMQRNVVATFKSGVQAFSELLYPDYKVTDKLFGINSSASRMLLDKISKDGVQGLTDAFSKKTLSTAIREGLSKTGTGTLKEMTEEEAAIGGDVVVNLVANKKSLDERDIPEELVQTAITTAISSLIPIGAGEMMQSNRTSGVKKSLIHEIGSDAATYVAQINNEVLDGKISQSNADRKISVVNTMADIVNNQVPNVSPANQNPLTEKDKIDYSYNLLHKRMLEDMLEKTTDDVQKEIIEKQINELKVERQNILQNADGVEKNFDGKPIYERDTKLSEPIEGLYEQGIPIGENEPKPTDVVTDSNAPSLNQRSEEDIFTIISAPVPTGKLKRMEVQVKSIDPETNEVTLEKMTAKKAIVDMKKQIGIIDLIKKCL